MLARPYNAAMHQPKRDWTSMRCNGATSRRLAAIAWLLCRIAFICLPVGCGPASSTPSPAPNIQQTVATPCPAQVVLVSTPDGAQITLDGQAAGQAPLQLAIAPGHHQIGMQLGGYEPVTRQINARPGSWLTVSCKLLDVAAPRVSLEDIPEEVVPAAGLKIVARADDNAQVVAMTLTIDGLPVAQAFDGSLRHNLDTQALAPGDHTLTIEARDARGNVGLAQAKFNIVAPTVVSSPTATLLAATATRIAPTVAPTVPTHNPTATVRATTRGPAVLVSWRDLTIDTYDYQPALYSDPDRMGHPYPQLHSDKVGPPRPVRYRALILRNRYLELTFLPELGGRLYQCRYLPTGQTIFYNNRVIKPTHWGPEDQGWWLAVGGMEWCLPVNEHGYLTAQPWDCTTRERPDGGAVVTMATETHNHLRVAVDVALAPDSTAIQIGTAISNVGDQSQRLQYWINAMLAPGSHSAGPGLRFYYPTDAMTVHSRGNAALPDAHGIVNWPIHGERNLARYDAWKGLAWLGLFASELETPYNAIYDIDSQIGLVRIFPQDMARGSKLFGFGPDSGLSSEYTDDDSYYVEMWGGLPATFWEEDDVILDAGQRITWEESWYVIARCPDIVAATEQACLGVQQDGQTLAVYLYAPETRQWTLQVLQAMSEIHRESIAVGPGQPLFGQVSLAGNTTSAITVNILEGDDAVLSWQQD